MEFDELSSDLERCRDLLEAEQYAKAYALAVDLLAWAPLDPEVVSAFCDAALYSDRAAESVRAARRFLESGERDMEVLEWLARAQWDLHLTEECRRTCLSILEHEPANYTALDYGLAALLELGDFEDSGDIVDRAAEHGEGDPHLTYQTAVARMMRGEDDWARRTFEEFLEREPDEPGTYINLMRIHHLAEAHGKVEELYHRAASRGLLHEDLDFNMGLALKAQDRDREAARYFLKAARKNGELPDAHFHLGQILRSEAHPLFGLWILERELRVDDTHPAVHAEMAWCAEDLGEYDAAVRMIRAAVERAPEWGVYQHSLAELLLKADPMSAEAEGVARSAVGLDEKHAAGWQVLGRILNGRGEIAEAERCLRLASKATDATAEDRGWLGLLLSGSDRVEEAIPHLELAARLYPFWAPVVEELGRIRGEPLPSRFEIRLTGEDGKGGRWYRVMHVVAGDEAGARKMALDPVGAAAEPALSVEEIRPLGCEVDQAPGVVWDSGRTGTRYPLPPPPID